MSDSTLIFFVVKEEKEEKVGISPRALTQVNSHRSVLINDDLNNDGIKTKTSRLPSCRHPLSVRFHQDFSCVSLEAVDRTVPQSLFHALAVRIQGVCHRIRLNVQGKIKLSYP